MASFFVSYSKQDMRLATLVVEGLKKRKHSVVWDKDLFPGQDWRAFLTQAVRDSTVLLPILTKQSITSSYLMHEIGAAQVLGKLVMPLLFDDIDYPTVVKHLHCLSANEHEIESALDEIDRGISICAADNKKVFIVHGQNEAKKLELKDFLAKLNLDPMILHQQNDLGKTIIEKFEHYAPQCAFAVILLTPDDQVSPPNSPAEAKWRARQNVILELGWFMAKLGRDRVLILHQGHLEIPSDLLGVVYAPFVSSIVEVSEIIRERLTAVRLIS